MTFSLWWKALAASYVLAMALVFTATPTAQQPCPPGTVCTPTVPKELPTEVELELAPGSLKDAPLWHEVAELLENPYAISCTTADDAATPTVDESNECVALTPRRPSFLPAGCSYQAGAARPCNDALMPPLKIWSPNANVLTGQPLRLRVSDGEISWDQPGPLFGPDDGDPTTPVTDIIGALEADADGNLVVSNPDNNADLPPDGTIVAVPAFNALGQIVNEDGVVDEFEKPISELDFLRPAGGRSAAQALGKALFWDMQVGSDGVQACGSCHFHAGTDNRTKNQLNPNHLGGDHTFQVKLTANQELVASDFPFRRLGNLDGHSEGDGNPVVRDSNDVASSMGVRFRRFGDIPPIGLLSFGPPANPMYPAVKALLPDVGIEAPDPILTFQGFRRVEPRNTPTIFGTAFNFDNFWDGRARHDANGGSVFGPADPQFHVFIDPGGAGATGGNLQGANNGHFRPELSSEEPEVAEQPVRIRFSSLGSLATGPAISDFEMSFQGRNWAKIGKKLLQANVTPLANQLVDPNDSVLGPFSNQRSVVGGPITSPGRTGLNISYPQLIRQAFIPQLWHNTTSHLNGAPAVCASDGQNGVVVPDGCDPFDGYVLTLAGGAAMTANTNQFTQMEANFSLFFGLSLQIWQELLTPDNSPFDRFMDANPRAANAVAQPGEQGTLFPSEVPGLVGPLTLVPGFGAEEIFGFDNFAGANLTAALPRGNARNPAGQGSNPFHRSARCMICHIGPEQTDHTNNVNAGLLQSSTEFEYPTPPLSPEPTGPFRFVTGISLAEEVEENAQDGVEVENRDFAIKDNPLTPYHEAQIGSPSAIAFQDNGVYNIGVRPSNEDIMRGGNDPFGWPLSLAALAMKNLAGPAYEPCDTPGDPGALSGNEPPTFLGGPCGNMSNFDPNMGRGGGLFEETGADQRINPGLEMPPASPLLPEYLAPWANNLPAGELSPQIDELAFAPNTITEAPFAEFGEILFGADFNCGVYDPGAFGAGPPNFGWGPRCPNSQTGIPVNFDPPLNGTWPFANRVARNGAVKAPQLRNVELTGPYFHTGSYLTLRQVVDFYMRGGDFPITNQEDRDPHMVDVGLQAFGFGTTKGLPPEFQDGIPDTISQYGPMPDTGHASTPEPANATPEAAKVALVRFLLALTDSRVKFEQAPFDHPEVFVPLDGLAPDNTLGRQGLANLDDDPSTGTVPPLPIPMFRRIRAVGAAGNATPLPNFLEISSTAPCMTPVVPNSHFCR